MTSMRDTGCLESRLASIILRHRPAFWTGTFKGFHFRARKYATPKRSGLKLCRGFERPTITTLPYMPRVSKSSLSIFFGSCGMCVCVCGGGGVGEILNLKGRFISSCSEMFGSQRSLIYKYIDLKSTIVFVFHLQSDTVCWAGRLCTAPKMI